MQEIVISLVAAVARKFMHDRHADLYLGSKRDDFGWCETTPQYLIVGLNVALKGPFPLVGESEVSRESDVSRTTP
jgi:hypothetical protein